MTAAASSKDNFIEWEAAVKVHPREVVCGDNYLVTATSTGILLCVIDGLGHGREAANASDAVVKGLRADPNGSVKTLLNRCNEILKPTRGAVLSLALINTSCHTLEWAGVGNVEAVVVHKNETREWLPMRGGIVGSRFPNVHSQEVSIGSGDLIVMCTDGIRSDFASLIFLPDQAQGLANRILRSHAIGHDDAIVLVARYIGGV